MRAWMLALLLVSPLTHADDFQVFELRDTYLNAKKFFPGGRDPLVTGNGLPNRELGEELNLHLDTDVLRYGYWNNMVHTVTDSIQGSNHGQFRVIGWNFQFGLHATRWLDIQYEHYSQHEMDWSLPSQGFPVQDSIGINLFFFRSGAPARALVGRP